MVSADRVTIFIQIRHYHADHLRAAVQSVLSQDCPDWQLRLLVYRDHEPEFRRLLAGPLADERVKLVFREGHNLAGAYNTAMRTAETEFIAVLLGDDLLAPGTVGQLHAAIRAHPEADFFHAGRYFVDAAGRRISSDYLPDRPVTATEFVHASPVKHLMCWRVSLGLSCGGVDESLANFASDDWDFPWTMLEHGAVFQAIPRALYALRDHRDGFRLTTHVPRSVQEEGLRRILAKHGVPPAMIRAEVRKAGKGYLKQSLFRNPLHRWLRERLGYKAGQGWREPYR